MSNIEAYPKNSYYLVVKGSALELGSYELPADGDLSLAQLRVYHKKTGSYSYQMRLVVSSRAGGPVIVASDWVTFSNGTTLQTTSDWLGDVCFDFPAYKLSATENYFVRMEVTGYARAPRPNQNTAYLAVWADWMQPVGITDTAGARIALGVKR
jgi:hypothetical protein